jgi:hypothetical protein
METIHKDYVPVKTGIHIPSVIFTELLWQEFVEKNKNLIEIDPNLQKIIDEEKLEEEKSIDLFLREDKLNTYKVVSTLMEDILGLLNTNISGLITLATILVVIIQFVDNKKVEKHLIVGCYGEYIIELYPTCYGKIRIIARKDAEWQSFPEQKEVSPICVLSIDDEM